jgi:hypothetical protein
MANRQRMRFVVAVILSLIFNGCSKHFTRDLAASTMLGFGEEYATPWFLASEDTDLMCSVGEGMSALTYPLGPKVDPLAPMLSLAAATCAEERA